MTGLLTDDEIKAIWLASYRYGDFGALCRALILSGQRLNQFNSFQHSWIENDVIVFPASIMKGKEAHTLPLTDNPRANMSIGAGSSP